MAHGRCIFVDPTAHKIVLWSEAGKREFEISDASTVRLGDIVEVNGQTATVLTPNRSRKGDSGLNWISRILDPRRIKATRVRAEIEAGIREFFLSREFTETRTPLLVPCPGMEPHIRPFRVSNPTHSPVAYLPTSPEFAMKRLLVGGLERIFQLCPAFRDEPRSRTHFPEFTMLEWYRAYAGYDEIMLDTEQLMSFLAQRLFGEQKIRYQGREISVAAPWSRLRVRDLFMEHAQLDLVTQGSEEQLSDACRRLDLKIMNGETADDLYFKIWLNCIEPKLPEDRAVFVVDYPASQAALSVIKTEPDGSRWAKRFEVYAGGLELGNAFEELTDPIEQRKRFVEDMALRERVYGSSLPKNPSDEEFLEALEEGMPPSGGNAMGVDRIVMLFADEPDIGFTRWLG